MLANNTGGGLFGTPQPGLGRGGGGLANPGGGGLFGRTAGGGLFGSGGGGGLGGGGGGGGLFSQTPAASQSGGLFGGGGLTGGLGGTGLTGGLGGTGTGLFQTPQMNQQKQGGLFGQSPMLGGTNTGGLVGGSGGGGLFGQTNSVGTGGLFSKPQASGLGGGGLQIGQSGTGLQLGQTGGLGQGGGLFGGGLGLGGLGVQQGNQVAQGTAGTKYEATKSTDTLNKSGTTVSVNTLLHCITAINSYSQKSLEELRSEDYSAGRKGSATAGGGLFGGATNTGMGLAGGGGGGGGLFSQNKVLGTGGALGGGGILGNQNQLGGGLGGTSTGGGLFGNQSRLGGGGLFGNTPGQNKLGGGLGAGGGGGLFSQQQQQQSGQVGGGLLGAGTGAAGGGLFGQSGTGLQLGGGGGLGQTQLGGGGLFNRGGGVGQTGGLGGLGTSGGLGLAGGLGGLGTSTGGWGGLGNQIPQSSSGLGLFNKPATSVSVAGSLGFPSGQLGGGVGAGLSLGGGLGLGTGGLNLGGGGGLGGNRLGGGSLMGAGGATGFGGGGLSQNLTLGQSPLQQQQQEAQLKQQLEMLANSPFGDSPLFRSAISDASKLHKNKDPPTPVASKPNSGSLQYKLNMRPSSKVKTISLSSPARHKEKNRLFEGLEDSPSNTSLNGSAGGYGETFVPRKSIKKLTIRPKPTQPQAWPDSTTPTVNSPAQPSPIYSRTEATDFSLTPNVTQTKSAPSSSGRTPPTSTQSTSLETPEITLGNQVHKNPSGIRPLTSILSPIPASSSTPASAREKKTVTLVEPEVTDSLVRSPLRHSPSKKQSTERACGVILTKDSYYTLPHLDECDGLVKDGTCIVDGFTIGRRGYAEIHFPGKTDIFGLDLDRIVTIESKEVVVYPDDLPDPKPKVGEKLNKPALVSMHEFWPKDKTTREFIKDEDRLERMNYAKKLKGMVAKIGGEYVDYKPDTGSCVFKVEHFSKYKLDADDDDSDEDGENQNKTVKKLKTVQSTSTNKKHVPLQPLPQVPPCQTGTAPTPQTEPMGSYTAPISRLTSDPQPTSRNVVRLDDDESMSNDDDDDDDNFEDAMDVPPSISIPPAEELVGSKTHHVQIMKASFFNKSDAMNRTLPSRSKFDSSHQLGSTSVAVADPPLLSHDMPPPPSSILDPFSRFHPPPHSSLPTPKTAPPLLSHDMPPPTSSILDPFSRFHPPHSSLPTPKTAITSLQAQSALLMSKRDLRILVPEESNIAAGMSRTHSLCDHGLFLGRSFRVGWGPNWTLVHSGIRVSSPPDSEASGRSLGIFPSHMTRSSESGHPIRVVCEKVKINNSQNTCDSFEPFLESQLENTHFSNLDDPPLSDPAPPLCTPVSGTTLLNAFSEVAKTHPLPSPKEGDEDTPTQRQLRRVLQLSVVLWGDLPSQCSPEREMYEHQLTRRQRVYQWLKETNRRATERETSSDPDSEEEYLKTLFSLACGQQLYAAHRLAQKKKDHKLAHLLSQATYTTHSNRAFLCKQLEDWRRQDSHLFIHPTRLKLYVLLAGLITWTSHSSSSSTSQPISVVNTCDGMDWKRAFAIYLCFHSKVTSPISDVLLEYMNDFQGSVAQAPPPCPPYMEARGDTPLSPLYDSCYHLLQLYCNRDYSMELTLQPAGSTSHLLDYRISWILWSLLCSLDYTHMRPPAVAHLLVSFANQLESCGKWHWAVFILLHLEDPVLSKSSVQSILDGNCSSGEELSRLEVFVLDQLHVPREWVFCAKAQRAYYEQWYDLMTHHLLQAGHWSEAHNILVEYLAVDAIISGDTDELLHMLEQLAEPERSASVLGWECGGSVFLDYLHISRRFQELSESEDDPSELDLESLFVGLKQLPVRIGQLASDTPKQVLCQSEMAKKTANFTRVMLELRVDMDAIEDHGGYISLAMVACLQQMPMPPDYAITEYRSLLTLNNNSVSQR